MSELAINWSDLQRRADAAKRKSHALTDRGNGYRLAIAYADRIRYCRVYKRWYEWDGTRWRPDDRDEALRLASTVADLVAAAPPPEAEPDAVESWVRRSQSLSKIRAALTLAGTLDGIAVAPSDLDADPWLLNVRNGTMRLGRWEWREPNPEDLLTKQTEAAFDLTAEAPTFDAFLERAVPDPAVRDYLQRCVGYSLLGLVREHVGFILHGPTASGKSTFLEAVAFALGDYAQVAPSSVVTGKGGEIRNDQARLDGARFVIVSETDEGTPLQSADFKRLTGGDTIVARYLYAEHFEFDPTHTLWVSTNHLPDADGADAALWRRIKVIHFPNQTPAHEQDPVLKERLRLEADGILRWALDGLTGYLERGLSEPQVVRHFTEKYRRESDPVGLFIEEKCVVDNEFDVAAGDLYDAYRMWVQRRGERPMTQAAFGRRLSDRGFERRKSGVHMWLGLRLKG